MSTKFFAVMYLRLSLFGPVPYVHCVRPCGLGLILNVPSPLVPTIVSCGFSFQSFRLVFALYPNVPSTSHLPSSNIFIFIKLP